MDIITKVENMSKLELAEAHTSLLNLQFGYVNSMAIKCAVDLGIPNIINSHGSSISLLDLAAAIPIPLVKVPHLLRLLRLLVHLGVFTVNQTAKNDHEPMYGLTPVSEVLLSTNAHAKMVLDPYLVNPCFYFGDWLKIEGSMPFEICHGGSMWEVAARKSDFNLGFNAAMASDSQFLMNTIVEKCPHVFQGLRTLIDVGGGIGVTARTIAKAFPHLDVRVLDLPHVVAEMPADAAGNVEAIGGDMFKYIPPADAVFLKWILHDWNDEECVQILRKCKEAIPQKGGKVILVEVVMNSKSGDQKHTQAQYLTDVIMMSLTTGWERDEKEWGKIFSVAGFKEYKVTPCLGVRSLIELYP